MEKNIAIFIKPPMPKEGVC